MLRWRRLPSERPPRPPSHTASLPGPSFTPSPHPVPAPVSRQVLHLCPGCSLLPENTKTRPPRPVCSSPGREPVLSLSTSPAGLVMTQPVEILGELMEGGRKARVSPGPQSPCGLPYFYFFQLPGTNGLHPSKSLKRGCQAHSEKEGMACPAPPRRPLWPCAE